MTITKNTVQERLRRGFAAFLTLCGMQLKEKLDLSAFRTKRSAIFKIVWLAVEFIAVTVLCWLLFYAVKMLGIFSLVGDVPDTVMNIVFTVMMTLSVIFETAGLVKSLYFSKDNEVLLTLPAPPAVVFLSKLAVNYVYDFRRSFMFIIPVFAAFGIAKGYPAFYYPWLVFVFLFLSALPVLLAALLSIPCMFGCQLFLRIRKVQYALYALLGILVVVGALFLISLIPENIDLLASWGETYWKIQDFLAAFTEATPVFYFFTQLIVGQARGLSVQLFTADTLAGFGWMLLTFAGLLALDLLLSGSLFYKMASRPFEFKKQTGLSPRKNDRRPAFFSALRKEITVGVRSNELLTKAASAVILMPTAVALLNKLYSAMNTRYVGTQMTVSFTVLLMLLMLMTCNLSLASCFSRDGATAYLNKVQPTPCARLLLAKLVPNLLIGAVGTAFAVFLYGGQTSLSSGALWCLGLTVYFVFTAHAFWSAEKDVMRPQTEQYATFNEQANNPNENASALLLFLLSAAVFGAALLLSLENGATAWKKLAVLTGALAAAKIATFFLKVRAFYMEK